MPTDAPSSRAPSATIQGKAAWRGHAVGVTAFVAYLGTFFALLQWHYPQVSHDYRFVFAILFEDAWNLIRGGLSIPRYAVHLCGGSVLYGHPLDMFYSPVHLLSWITDPWIAVQLTILVAFVVGYLGWYRLARDLLGLECEWSHLLALVVLANGFHLMHLLAGHFTYHGFTLLGWLLWLFFERNPEASRTHVANRAIAFGLLGAYLIYSGNWIVLFFFPLTCVLALPLDLLAAFPRGRRLRELGLRGGLFAGIALALTASKLVAVWSFIRHFPRVVPLDVQDPTRSVLGDIFRALWVAPPSSTMLVQSFGYVHEQSMLLSPITLVGLVAAFVIFLMSVVNRKGKARVRLLLFASIYGGLTLLAMVQVVGGKGWLAEKLHNLPLGSSQHVSSRYLYPFSLLLSVAAIGGLAALFRRSHGRWHLTAVALAASTTVAGFAAGYARVLPSVGLFENADDYRSSWKKLGNAPTVTSVVPSVDFFAGSVQGCYEPILNASGSPFGVLHLGPVTDQSKGYFNLMNPSCYQYPEENHCRPGDRISVEDAENLERFASGRPTTWKVSRTQQVADVTSGVCLVGMVIFLRYARVWRKRKRLAKSS